MTVYHGSDTIVDAPKILGANRPLDFGGGFYVTTSEEQAKRWAKKVSYRNATFREVVNCYDFDLSHAQTQLTVIQFDCADEKWLDFICSNRRGNSTGMYDVVIGPVADDKVYRVVVEYENGDVDKQTALKNLKTEKLCNQIVFHTERSIHFLKFIKAEEGESNERTQF